MDASKLQGYLTKEKSKTGLLHGLTGDVNKRYFRVQKIEVRYLYYCVLFLPLVSHATSFPRCYMRSSHTSRTVSIPRAAVC